MAIWTEVREEFAEGFDAGFEWLDRRRRLSNWRWFQSIRALDGVLELINERIKSDPRDALRQGDRVLRLVLAAQLSPIGPPVRSPDHPVESPRYRPPSADPRMDLSWPALEGMTWAVIASCQTVLDDTEDSLDILHAMSLRDLPAAIRASVFRRRAMAYLECKTWIDAEKWANASVELAEVASYRTWWKTPFRSLASALWTRSYVVGAMYEFGVVGVERLEGVAADAIRTAELARKERFRHVEAAALDTLARAGALGAFGGCVTVQVPKVPRGSVHWSKLQWTNALVQCARARTLTPPAEAAFHDARDDFETRGLVDEGFQVTIDLQWWLLASGATRRAALESQWLLRHLEHTSFDPELITNWIRQVQERHVSTQLVATVYREVRGLPRGPVPQARLLR